MYNNFNYTISSLFNNNNKELCFIVEIIIKILLLIIWPKNNSNIAWSTSLTIINVYLIIYILYNMFKK